MDAPVDHGHGMRGHCGLEEEQSNHNEGYMLSQHGEPHRRNGGWERERKGDEGKESERI